MQQQCGWGSIPSTSTPRDPGPSSSVSDQCHASPASGRPSSLTPSTDTVLPPTTESCSSLIAEYPFLLTVGTLSLCLNSTYPESPFQCQHPHRASLEEHVPNKLSFSELFHYYYLNPTICTNCRMCSVFCQLLHTRYQFCSPTSIVILRAYTRSHTFKMFSTALTCKWTHRHLGENPAALNSQSDSDLSGVTPTTSSLGCA